MNNCMTGERSVTAARVNQVPAKTIAQDGRCRKKPANKSIALTGPDRPAPLKTRKRLVMAVTITTRPNSCGESSLASTTVDITLTMNLAHCAPAVMNLLVIVRLLRSVNR